MNQSILLPLHFVFANKLPITQQLSKMSSVSTNNSDIMKRNEKTPLLSEDATNSYQATDSILGGQSSVVSCGVNRACHLSLQRSSCALYLIIRCRRSTFTSPASSVALRRPLHVASTPVLADTMNTIMVTTNGTLSESCLDFLFI